MNAGGVRRFATPGAVSDPAVKFSFWASMADLWRLVMRSAPRAWPGGCPSPWSWSSSASWRASPPR
uniref:Uncharacterized protein n=1 Tax=Phenylobacterium glaciei TaxID=2803784 RepID=A0A974P7F3_9CAUL|nr:hypothetical protein JKL49_13360 [Phenylobacterium glaciei]